MTRSNLDKTRMVFVRKGCTVRFGPYLAKVSRVRMGTAYCCINGVGETHMWPCSAVEVRPV